MTSPMLSRLPRGYRNDRRFGLVYDHRPDSADDLTMIAGIATREAVTLNRLGVYFLAQIALWRPAELLAFAEELQMSPVQIADERWVEQARVCCQGPLLPAAHPVLPASFPRTFALLTCALLIGCLVVYLLGQRQRLPLQGILSADITSLKVPAAARLVATHVKPGDEVFSGAPLLTLEKAAHLQLIREQEGRVQQLQQDLQQAEAKADLEIAWRVRELEHELFDARQQMASIQEVRQQLPAVNSSTAARSAARPMQLAPVSTTQRTAPRPHPARHQAGGLLFFSGASGQSTKIEVARERGLPPVPAPTRIAQAKPASVSEPVPVSESVAAALVNSQVQTLEARVERLESLKAALPEQVRQAAGIEHLRFQLTDASERLDEMKSVSREVAVTAPAYGVVGQVRFREGDHMPEGEIMLKILHTDRRYVTLYVPTRRVNELQPGSQVSLTFPGGARYRGEVTDLPLLADTVVPGGESLAAVRIEPVGKLWPQVPIGSQIDVAIVP